LKKEMVLILGQPHPLVVQGNRPFVILAVGVNGVGKTTTIGKLANRFRSQGLSVLLAAGDTFRAAGIEQLEIWADRAKAQFVKHKSGSDPAAVAFDAIEAARHREIDIVIIDTAGRLHTKSPLMEELKKVKRVIEKAMPGAPQENLLVVDATTGQNALRQADMFNQAIGITGIALTKLDGTAKGGIVFAIKKDFGIPVRLIGIGEGLDDLRDFNPEEFVEALFA
jgi:fused signal recognition particle receptor